MKRRDFIAAAAAAPVAAVAPAALAKEEIKPGQDRDWEALYWEAQMHLGDLYDALHNPALHNHVTGQVKQFDDEEWTVLV